MHCEDSIIRSENRRNTPLTHETREVGETHTPFSPRIFQGVESEAATIFRKRPRGRHGPWRARLLTGLPRLEDAGSQSVLRGPIPVVS